ncbi:MAG: hypothetical protein NZ529_11730, partial [Cytophagaceae bacterium]|nr:hypothetical protein [Cytophagaceae bacterium]MDW8457454.1 hypothetical protein [Cytophagaceae bacterium]
GEKPYEAETLDFLLRDSTDNSYMISVGAYVGYSQLKQPFNYLNISLFNTINNGKIVFIEIPEERSPLLLGSFHTSKYLLDKSFTDVYEGFKFSDMSSFSDLFYTIKEGVVGFRDKNNKLWVLERFE